MITKKMLVCLLLLVGAVSAAAQDQEVHAHRIRVGGKVMAAKMIKQVQPIYPMSAKQARITGTVILHAVIAKDGSVQEVQYVSGPKELMRASMDAVRQWKYMPTLLQGEPVEVDTTISIIYTLGKSADAADLASHGMPNVEQTDQQSETQPAKPIDPQLKADTAQLIQELHVSDTMTQVIKMNIGTVRAKLTESLPNTPNRDAIIKEFVDKFVEVGHSPELLDALEGIYAKYLTDEQVKKAIEFYKTDTGEQILAMQGKMMEEVQPIAARIGSEKAVAIIKELCGEYPELQEQGNTCKQ
jgi:TonB family protein